jgi:DNA-binding transcriptional MerR regulator
MALAKSADAFRTISEAAGELDVPQHVLRHWEEVFGQIRPMRRAGGRRYYRPFDIDVLRGVRVLLYGERYTTRGVQKIFKEYGVKYIAEIGRLSAAGQTIELRPILDEDAEDRAPEGAALVGLDEDGAPGAYPSTSVGRTPLAPDLRKRLAELLARLEGVQEALDEANLALEAIDTEGERG